MKEKKIMLNRLKYELNVFRQLQPDAKNLLLSFFCQLIASELIYVFANAYLFVNTHDISSVAVFNLGFYLSVLLGCYINAWLIKNSNVSVKTVFISNSILQGAWIAVLFLFHQLSMFAIFGVSLLAGFTAGLYWANRNFIYPALTNDDQRDYISGLNTLVGNISEVILPLLGGWIIVWTRSQPYLNARVGYTFVFGAGILILVVGAWFLSKIKDFPRLKITNYRPQHISPDWKLFRKFTLFSTFQMAVSSTVVEVITLLFIGDEETLGIIRSVLAILVGIITYVLGRKMKPRYRFQVLWLSTIPLVIAVLLLLASFNQLTLIVYIMAMIIASNIFWFIYISVMSNETEKQDQGEIEDNYAYILDYELFINFGRVTSMLVILWVLHFADGKLGLLIALVLGAIFQIIAMVFAKQLLKTEQNF